MVRHGLGDRVRHADTKLQRLFLAAREADGVLQIVAQGKNLLGVSQCHAALAGQFQPSPPFAKEIMTQPGFQLLDLARQGLGCGVELLTRAHHAARLGNRPEIAQVFEVHIGLNTSKKTINKL
ncbi:hypothetical protein D3C71_1869260 [compost metagenome]